MKMTIYNKRKEPYGVSSVKVKFGDQSVKYDKSFNITGRSSKFGGMTQFTDASFNPTKFGIKLNGKTQYFNAKTFRPYKSKP
jgi:hypothetical protein